MRKNFKNLIFVFFIFSIFFNQNLLAFSCETSSGTNKIISNQLSEDDTQALIASLESVINSLESDDINGAVAILKVIKPTISKINKVFGISGSDFAKRLIKLVKNGKIVSAEARINELITKLTLNDNSLGNSDSEDNAIE